MGRGRGERERRGREGRERASACEEGRRPRLARAGVGALGGDAEGVLSAGVQALHGEAHALVVVIHIHLVDRGELASGILEANLLGLRRRREGDRRGVAAGGLHAKVQ